MKRTTVMFLTLGIALFLVPESKAQKNYVFSSFQCDPLSCNESTPIPVFQGNAFVSYEATCTGGIVGSISGRALSQIGVPEACRAPYTPHAQIKRKTDTLLDDFGCEYEIESAIEIAEVIDASGSIVLHEEAGVSCDGGTSGPFSVGTKPC